MTELLYVDTCALADKGLSLACRLGFLDGQKLWALKSIVRESLRLRTAPVPEKREVGQQAVVTLAEIHSLPRMTIILDTKEPTAMHPDDDLLNRARAVKGSILTADTGLQERAKASEIGVVSMQGLNDRLRSLSSELSILFPPTRDITQGELLTVRIAKRGQQEGQGIGYLEDGRKVIVTNGAHHVGAQLEVQVDHLHRTSPGHEIIFASLMGNGVHL